MLGRGNCPKCEKPVTHCALDEIGVSDKLIGASFHGIAMCCPHCRTVLGVTADPEILINDIACRVLHKLSGMSAGGDLVEAKPYRNQRGG